MTSPPLRIVDSITELRPHDAGCVAISGSHGGISSAQYALAARPLIAVFNDAGIGKDEAGVVALTMLQEQGTPAAAIAHTTGRIGDALDMWEHGYLSRVNEAAAQAGLVEGMSAREAARRLAKSF